MNALSQQLFFNVQKVKKQEKPHMDVSHTLVVMLFHA